MTKSASARIKKPEDAPKGPESVYNMFKKALKESGELEVLQKEVKAAFLENSEAFKNANVTNVTYNKFITSQVTDKVGEIWKKEKGVEGLDANKKEIIGKASERYLKLDSEHKLKKLEADKKMEEYKNTDNGKKYAEDLKSKPKAKSTKAKAATNEVPEVKTSSTSMVNNASMLADL